MARYVWFESIWRARNDLRFGSVASADKKPVAGAATLTGGGGQARTSEASDSGPLAETQARRSPQLQVKLLPG